LIQTLSKIEVCSRIRFEEEATYLDLIETWRSLRELDPSSCTRLTFLSFFWGREEDQMGSKEEKRMIPDLESGVLVGGRTASGGGVVAGSEYYVGLAGSQAEAAAAAVAGTAYLDDEEQDRNRQRRALRVASTVFVTICCLIVALHGVVSLYPRIEAFVRGTAAAPSALFLINELQQGSVAATMKLRDDHEAVQQPHRTSFHYQPAKNWMNGTKRSPHLS
jgi:hypothetical protein